MRVVGEIRERAFTRTLFLFFLLYLFFPPLKGYDLNTEIRASLAFQYVSIGNFNVTNFISGLISRPFFLCVSYPLANNRTRKTEIYILLNINEPSLNHLNTSKQESCVPGITTIVISTDATTDVKYF